MNDAEVNNMNWTELVNKQQRVEVKILKYQVVAHEMFQLFLQALLCA